MIQNVVFVADEPMVQDCVIVDAAETKISNGANWGCRQNTHLLLSVGPAGDLDDHVQDGLLLVGVERNVVEGRDGDAILLDVDAVLEGVGSTDLAGGEDARGVGESLSHCCCESCVLGERRG